MQPTDTTRAHCVDPETLAAWVEGNLTASDAAAVEVHLSTCARCQAIVAAFSAGDEDTHAAAPSAVVVPFWSRRSIQWAAATLAAAASLGLWTMNRPASAPSELRRGEPAQSVTAPQALPQAEPAPAAAAPPKARRAEPPPAEPFATTELMRAVAPAASAAAEPRRDKPALAPTEPRRAEPAPATPPPPAASAPAELRRAEPVPQAAPPPPPAAALPPVIPAPAVTAARSEPSTFRPMTEIVMAPATFEVISISDQNAPLDRDALMPRSGGRGGAAGGGAGNLPVGLAPRPQVRWRVTASAVERSVDSGRTWEPLDFDPPFILTAGSAPYQNVCWLVGHDGVVFRTTNGTSFERMTPPDTVHLRAIVATDALNAVVTAIDGRVFGTTDGGVTWRVRSLQENPATSFY